MGDEDKTRQQLIDELAALRGQVAALEAAASGDGRSKQDRAVGTAESDAARERDRLQAILRAAVECLPFEFFAIGTNGRYILQNAVLREHYGDGVGKRPEDLR